MSDESKPKGQPFEFPMMPIFGVDLGERLGDLAAGQRQLRTEIQRLDVRIDKLDARIDKLDAKIDAIDAKFEAKTDKMAYVLNRLDERTKHLSAVTWGGLVVLLIAIVAQKLL